MRILAYIMCSIQCFETVSAKMSVSGLVYGLEPQKKLHCEWFKSQYIVLEQYTFIFKQMLSPDNTNLNQNILPFTILEKILSLPEKIQLR